MARCYAISSHRSCVRGILLALTAIFAVGNLRHLRASRKPVSNQTPHLEKSKDGKLSITSNSIQHPKGALPRRLEDPSILKVPLPVFVLSLPKSGTTSIARYFQCGHQPTAHTFGSHERLGTCTRRNHIDGLPMLQGCGNYTVFSDMGNPARHECFYPSVHGLDNIATHYPYATIVLVVRNATDWFQSARAWGYLVGKWKLDCQGFPNKGSKQEDFLDFYRVHAARIRDLCRVHPSLTCIEVALESADTPRILEQTIGIPGSCWGNCQPSAPNCSYTSYPSSTKNNAQ